MVHSKVTSPSIWFKEACLEDTCISHCFNSQRSMKRQPRPSEEASRWRALSEELEPVSMSEESRIPDEGDTVAERVKQS